MGTSPACPGSPRARRPADDVVSEAVTWLARHDAAPFFVWIHLYDTHRPYRLPDDYARRYADPYAAAIAFEDAQIARLISHLEARDLLDDTLMVVAGTTASHSATTAKTRTASSFTRRRCASR